MAFEANPRVRCSALLVLFALSACSSGNGGPIAVTGQIEGVSVAVGSRVGGRVETVYVEEGQTVAAGDVLVQLEGAEFEAKVAAAQALLAQTEAAMRKLEAGTRHEQIRQASAVVMQAQKEYEMALKGARSQEIGAARAGVEAARAERDKAQGEYERFKLLYDQNVVSFRETDQAQHQFDAAKGNYDAALEELDLLVQGTREEEIAIAHAALERAQATLEELENGARIEDLDAARAVRDVARAQLDETKVMLREMTIVAPADGLVESIDVHPGDLVDPGPIVRIVDPEDLELVVYVGARMLGSLRIDETVALTTDSHGDTRFEGHISYIAAEGEYTPRNLQTEEGRVQQVFGVKVKLDSAGGKLRAGMAATVHFTNETG